MVRKLLPLVLILALALSLAACGGKDNNGGGSTSTDPKLQAVIDEAQGSIASLEEAFGGMMKIAIEARDGSKLVYIYTYTIDVGDVNAVKAELESGLEAQKAVFENIAKELRDEGVKNASVVVEYKNVDGTLIHSQEFK